MTFIVNRNKDGGRIEVEEEEEGEKQKKKENVVKQWLNVMA